MGPGESRRAAAPAWIDPDHAIGAKFDVRVAKALIALLTARGLLLVTIVSIV
jgi:hypothetical protein